MDDSTRQRISDLVNGNKVVLFMKGTRHFPQCGFSGAVVQMLNANKATYETVNVLADPAIREGIKEFASWPTIPQLYIGGEFVGGADIVRELHSKGELAAMIAKATAPQGS
ncbi:MAG: Grx4 family monothiol glutaredoxin [Deltaproteobacteria bacterium]|nr:Grx4 family monothiol glutaredoxin [Myxococcales bacterium]MDP3220482.1 Grx4 family monothiol glutaredoxin [Deltaproteobacteria bacterium]